MRFGILSVITLVCVFGMGAVQADVGDQIPAGQLTATSSTGSSASPAYADPMVVVNGSGLSGDSHASNGGTWYTDYTDPDRWIVVDLGGTYHIGEVKVWNGNEAWGWEAIGFNETSFYVSEEAEPGNPVDDPGKWTLVLSTTLNQGLGAAGVYDTPDVVDLGGNAASHVALVCDVPTGAYGDDRAGLSELRFFEGIPVVKGKAYDPDPEDGAISVPLDQVLSWTVGDDPNVPDVPNPAVTRHFVYMSDGVGTDLSLVDTVDAAEYTPMDLQRDKTYYWRIDEGIESYPAGDPNNIIGDVWSFETVLSIPIIDPAFPGEVVVFAGESAEFSVVATNPFGDQEDLSYQWYKYVDGVDDTPVATGDTYTIGSVQDSDQGSYYCTVTIGSNSAAADSSMAELTTKRLVGHWPFDNNYDDIVGGNDGDPNGTMEFVAGIEDGSDALAFNGVDSSVSIPPAALSQIYSRVTISVWLFGGESQPSEDTVFEAYDDAGARVLGTHTPWGGSVYFDAGNPEGGADRINKAAAEDEYKGKWNHWVYVKDAVAGEMKLYLNGLVWQSGTDKNEPMYGATNFMIGRGYTGGQDYDGLIDDIRLYNYALDATEVGVLYSDVQGAFCANKPALDYSDNCKVDLADFAIFARSWMECGMFPECLDTIE